MHWISILSGNRYVSAIVVCCSALTATLCATACISTHTMPAPRSVTIVGPLTAFTWPTYIAKEGKYYEQYGLDVKLVFANHPAGIAMLVSGEADVNLNTLQQAIQLGPKYPSILVYGSPLRKWLFALITCDDIRSARQLKGKRIGIAQIGDSTYNYAIRLLEHFGLNVRDVEWTVTGLNSRVAAVSSRRVAATMLSAPAYFDLEEAGCRSIGNISDYDDIHTPNVLLLRRQTVAARPALPEQLIKAHAAAVKRFYEDKAFAISAHLVFDKQDRAGLSRVYDIYSKTRAFDRVPYIAADSVRYMMAQVPDSQIAAEVQSFDYRTVIDNTTVDRLVRDGFFRDLFGPDVNVEEKRQADRSFR